MGVISLEYVISYSSQDTFYKVENLLQNPGSEKPWLCSPLDKSGCLEAVFQLNKASYIDFIDVGNCGSSTVEIQVGRSSFQNGTNYVSFLPAVTLLSLANIKEGVDHNAVYMFNKTNMNKVAAEEKWDRIKVICCQPYKKRCQFGLSFLSLRTKESNSQLNIHDQPLFSEKNKRPHSKNLPESGEAQTPPFPDLIEFLLTRKPLLNASKLQNSTVIGKKKKAESAARFEEDSEIFLIACSGEDMEDKSYEEYMNEFEDQRQQKLNSSEKLIFNNKYLEIFHKNKLASKYNQNNSYLGKEVNRPAETNAVADPDTKKLNLSALNEQSLPLKKRKDARLCPPTTSERSSFDIEMKFPSKRKCIDSNGEGETKKKKIPTGSSVPTTLNHSRPEDFIQFDGIQPSTSRGFTLVDCPICSDSFLPSEIERHAATCGELLYT